MVHNLDRKMRGVALFTGGALLAGTLLSTSTPAQAIEKDKAYKTGAVALGVLGAYWIIKGKTLPGAAAAAGAYYAYKKGRDVQNDDRSSDDDFYPNRRRGSHRRDNSDNSGYRSSERYPDDYRAYGFAATDSADDYVLR